MNRISILETHKKFHCLYLTGKATTSEESETTKLGTDEQESYTEAYLLGYANTSL